MGHKWGLGLAVMALVLVSFSAHAKNGGEPNAETVPEGKKWFCYGVVGQEGVLSHFCERTQDKCDNLRKTAVSNFKGRNDVNIEECKSQEYAAVFTYDVTLTGSHEYVAAGSFKICKAVRDHMIQNTGDDVENVSKCAKR